MTAEVMNDNAFVSKKQLIKKMFAGIVITNVISVVAGIGCNMIDSIVTGQFLGPDAVAAAGLVQPMVLMVNLFGGLVCGGLNVLCTQYMGKAQSDRVNQVYSVTIIAAFTVSALMTLFMFFGAGWLADMLYAGGDNVQIHDMVRDYLKGFSLGLIPMRFTIMLGSIMMLDNDKNRSIMCMGATFVADAVFDLANVLVFHGGMLGMAIASSLSYVVGLLVVMTHYLKKDRVLRFTLKGLRLSDVRDVMLLSIASAIGMGSLSLRTLVFNRFLLSTGGNGAVASLSVANGAFSIANAVGIGMFMSSSVLCSLLYGEEDRHGLEIGTGIAIKRTITLMGGIMILVILFPHPIARLFVNASSPGILDQGASFIRFMGIQYLLMCGSYSLSGVYQGTKRLRLNYLIDIMREAVLPIVCVIALGFVMGIRGMEVGFALAGGLTLVLCFLIPMVCNKVFPKKPEDFLVLPDDFGARPEDLLELSVTSVEEAVAASAKVMKFCHDKGADKRTGMFMSLFFEEMIKNTIKHGFKKGTEGYIDIRMVYSDSSRIIRLRDNGQPFNPVEWLDKNSTRDPASGIGIRMVVGLAKSVQYMASMELNSLIIQL